MFAEGRNVFCLENSSPFRTYPWCLLWETLPGQGRPGREPLLEEPSLAPQDMFAFMGSLDTKGTSYKYEVALAGPALELHNCMAKLLAHPLQRPCQSHASYSLLEEEEEATEVEATV